MFHLTCLCFLVVALIQAFLQNAHSKVQEHFKAPFLSAVKDLVKSLRDPKTPAEEIEAVRRS